MATGIQVVFDCADPDSLARFWAEYFQRVPEAKTTKNRVHLDLNASGAHGTPLAERRRRIDAEVERLLGAGATRLGTLEGAGGYVVNMADPEGNEFDIQ
jgi:hypothetical protein